jgi:hypothetical protein
MKRLISLIVATAVAAVVAGSASADSNVSKFTIDETGTALSCPGVGAVTLNGSVDLTLVVAGDPEGNRRVFRTVTEGNLTAVGLFSGIEYRAVFITSGGVVELAADGTPIFVAGTTIMEWIFVPVDGTGPALVVHYLANGTTAHPDVPPSCTSRFPH